MASRSSLARGVAAWSMAACAWGSASAQETVPSANAVNIVLPIRYADDATARAAVREQCELEQALQSEVLDALRKRGGMVNEVASKDTGEAVEVSIHRVQGLGPWAGAKTLSVLVHEYKDGKATHVKMLSEHSNGYPLQTTCSILKSDAKSVARQLAAWLDDLDAPAALPAASAASR